VTPGATVIEVRGLVKDYHGLRPLRVASLDIRAGERVSISGLDAMAAEVFVNLLNGATVPDAGEIRMFGRLTTAIENEAEWFALLDRLGIVTLRAALLGAATARQNLALPFTLEIDNLPAELQARTGTLAQELGIDAPWLDRPLAAAPAHVAVRVHVGRALALDPAVLLLEHPTASIERRDVPALAVNVRDAAVARNLSVLALTEDDEFAGTIAQRTLKLQGGTGALVDRRGWRRWF
jgi:phospholipid/cholesterol/gamma-HCH transport system ATP-binding protein